MSGNYCFLLRWFVHELMRSQHAPDGTEEEKFWRQVACQDVNKEIQQARGKAKETVREEPEQPYVRLETPDLVAYLDLRNPRERIEAFCGDFKDCIPRKKVFLGMLETLEIIRNAATHNRPVSAEVVAEGGSRGR